MDEADYVLKAISSVLYFVGNNCFLNFLEKKGVIAFKKFSQTAEENEQDQAENSSDLPTGAENDQEDKKTSSRRRFFFKKS
jgi:hypothetical protein